MTGPAILRTVQLRVERQTVRHNRYDCRLLNWTEYYCEVGHKPARTYRTAPLRKRNPFPLERADYQPTQRNPVAA